MKTALASYPRSGNTYLRYLLFHCLGMKSGWVYGAERPAPHRTEEDLYDPESELLKTHNLDHSPFDQVIHLVRSPFDALEAYYYYSTEICETPRDWGEFIASESIAWSEHTEYWLDITGKPKLLLTYGDLRAYPAEQMRRVSEFLGTPHPDEEKIARGVEECRFYRMHKIDEKFFRRGLAGYGMRFFTWDQAHYVLDHCGVAMQKVGLLGRKIQ